MRTMNWKAAAIAGCALLALARAWPAGAEGSTSGGPAGTSGSSGGSSGSGGEGGGTGGAGGTGGGRIPGHVLAPSGPFAGTSLPAVRRLSRQVQESLAECSLDSPTCVADALDQYAAGLRQIELPPDLKSLPDVVSTAATRVRRAPSRQEAVRAIKVAISEVHKTISLIKADDPFTQRVETREGAFVAQTLQVADAKLEKAMGL